MTVGKTIGGSIGAIGILLLSQILAQVLASALLLLHLPVIVCNIAASILYLAFSYALLKAFAVKVLKLTLAELGIPSFHIDCKWLAIGILLPSSVIGIYFLFPGQLMAANMEMGEAVTTIVTSVCWVGLAAGFVEEMVFRGFILNLLDKKWEKNAAVLVPSVLFGLVHLIGMDFTALSCVLVIVAGTCVGIMFSMIQQAHHSVWNSSIVHALWNIITTSAILHIGNTVDPYSVWTYVLESDNFAMTGGDFGIESSMIAVAGYLIVTAFACCKRKQSE